MPLFGPCWKQLKVYINEQQESKRIALKKELKEYCGIPEDCLIAQELSKKLFPKQKV